MEQGRNVNHIPVRNYKEELTIMRKLVLSLFPALLILLSVVACGAKPVTIDELPVYPGAVAIESGQNSLADSLAQAMQQSAGEQGLQAHFRFFSVPAGTSWDDVKSFCSGEMQGLGWNPESSMAIEEGPFLAAGWSHGSGNNQQAFVVGYVPDVSGEGAFIVLGLFGQ
jgi:hypothetical protein